MIHAKLGEDLVNVRVCSDVEVNEELIAILNAMRDGKSMDEGIAEARSLYWGSIGLCFLGIGFLVALFFAFSPETLRLILRVKQPDNQTVVVSRIMIAAGLLQGLRSLSSTVHVILEVREPR